MSTVAEDIQEAYEEAFDAKREVYGEDFCDILGPTFTDGGASGDSVSLTVLATKVECFIEELSPAASQTVVGGEAYISSHRITMKRRAVVDVITPEYQLKVRARDGKPERIFEKPMISEGSFTPLAIFRASLVRQGFQ